MVFAECKKKRCRKNYFVGKFSTFLYNKYVTTKKMRNGIMLTAAIAPSTNANDAVAPMRSIANPANAHSLSVLHHGWRSAIIPKIFARPMM